MTGRRILIASASKHGATRGIADAIATRLQQAGFEAEARSVEDGIDLSGFDAVVLGSAVYIGSWLDEAVAFAHEHADALEELPVWLFSSGPLGVDVADEQEQPRQLSELTELIRPREHRMFYGALDRSTLGFGERMMVKAVKAPEGDFRDWDAITGWADEIAASLR